MNFSEENNQLKYRHKDKIVETIFNIEKKENKKNKINRGTYLRKKRKLFESKKNNNYNFKISRTITVFIKSTIIENRKTHETCIICLNEISFEDKHFLHCGHIFHCSCINLWINNGSNLCPICRRNIKCINEDYDLINLDENENSSNNNSNDNIWNSNNSSINNNRIESNNNRIESNNNRIIRDKIGEGLIKIMYGIIFFYGLYFFVRNAKVGIGIILAFLVLYIFFT